MFLCQKFAERVNVWKTKNNNCNQIWTDRQHTHFQLFSEDRPLSERRAVPAAVFELELTLVDAHLGSLSNDDNGIGAALADDPLPRSQTRDLVTDDART